MEKIELFQKIESNRNIFFLNRNALVGSTAGHHPTVLSTLVFIDPHCASYPHPRNDLLYVDVKLHSRHVASNGDVHSLASVWCAKRILQSVELLTEVILRATDHGP